MSDEAPPQTPLGELTVLPRPLSWIWGGERKTKRTMRGPRAWKERKEKGRGSEGGRMMIRTPLSKC